MPVAMTDHGDVTRILQEIRSGSERSEDELLRVVYGELRALARQRMAQERANHTWQPTDLVHEAFIRLVGTGESNASWQNRAHFFGAAAEAMRRVLVEYARKRGRIKRGGDRQRINLDTIGPQTNEVDDSVLAVHEALEAFEKIDREKAALVKLRYFAGLPLADAAQVLDISRATASRHWAYARAWLYDAIQSDQTEPGDSDGSSPEITQD